MFLIITIITCFIVANLITHWMINIFPMKKYFFTRNCIWFLIYFILIIPSLLLVNLTLLGGNQTVIDAAPTNVLYIIENYKATLIIFFPILFALAYIFDNILIWIKKRFIKK